MTNTWKKEFILPWGHFMKEPLWRLGMLDWQEGRPYDNRPMSPREGEIYECGRLYAASGGPIPTHSATGRARPSAVRHCRQNARMLSIG